MHPRSRLKRPVYVYKRRGLKNLRTVDWKILLKKFLHKHKRKIIIVVIIFVVILALIPPATYLYFAKDLKDKDSILNRGKTGLTLLDREGKTFYTFYQPKSISYVSFSEIPKTVQESAVATEDKNFYTNAGFSITGIARAFVVNIFAGKIVEGGSTITQELAKNAFLSSSRNILRKYQEIVLAAELHRRFSKQDILEMYLNSVYFGEGAFGIENAAQAYFGIPAHSLDLAQSTLLIGLLPAPSAYSPISNPPDKAILRQKIVLKEMVQDGYITQDQATAAENETLHYNPSKIQTDTFNASHFAVYIRKQLIQQYGEERVIRDGFRVTTTLDRDLQKYAQESVKTQVTRLQYNHAGNGAAVALNPKNGQILAMVGSYDWSDPKFGQTNMAIIPRQPGSSFKPIIYGRAFEDKLITPATMLQDVETTFMGSYKPHNYDLRYRGPVTARRALANSLNIPAVEVMEKVGVANGVDEAQKLGITTLNANTNYGLSLVLGTGEIPLLELTNAYATFADQGTYHKATGIMTIKDKYNNTVSAPTNIFSLLNPLNWFNFSKNDDTRQVMSKEATFLISSILSDNNARAETFGSALSIGRPAAVKTGTTEDYRDALTVGYTPSFVVGVWVGNNDNTHMDDIAGSLGAAPIWRNVMEHYLMGTPIEQFARPTFVVSELVCPYNSFRYTEYFIAGTQTESCATPTAQPSPTMQTTVTPAPTTTPPPGPTAVQPTTTPLPQVIPTTAPTALPAPTVKTLP